MIAGLLVLGFAALCAGAWAAFNDRFRQGEWFIPFSIALSVVIGLVYSVACKYLDDKTRILVFGLVWDALMVVAYYVLPVALMGVRVTPGLVVGGVLVLAGFVVIKLGA